MWFDGYASVTGFRDRHNDVIARSSFTFNLPIPVYIEHSKQIGVINFARQDQKSLFVRGKIIDQTSLKSFKADIFLSIGYSVRDYTLHKNVRTITNLYITEVSIVKRPSNRLCIGTIHRSLR